LLKSVNELRTKAPETKTIFDLETGIELFGTSQGRASLEKKIRTAAIELSNMWNKKQKEEFHSKHAVTCQQYDERQSPVTKYYPLCDFHLCKKPEKGREGENIAMKSELVMAVSNYIWTKDASNRGETLTHCKPEIFMSALKWHVLLFKDPSPQEKGFTLTTMVLLSMLEKCCVSWLFLFSTLL